MIVKLKIIYIIYIYHSKPMSIKMEEFPIETIYEPLFSITSDQIVEIQGYIFYVVGKLLIAVLKYCTINMRYVLLSHIGGKKFKYSDRKEIRIKSIKVSSDGETLILSTGFDLWKISDIINNITNPSIERILRTTSSEEYAGNEDLFFVNENILYVTEISVDDINNLYLAVICCDDYLSKIIKINMSDKNYEVIYRTERKSITKFHIFNSKILINLASRNYLGNLIDPYSKIFDTETGSEIDNNINDHITCITKDLDGTFLVATGHVYGSIFKLIYKFETNSYILEPYIDCRSEYIKTDVKPCIIKYLYIDNNGDILFHDGNNVISKIIRHSPNSSVKSAVD